MPDRHHKWERHISCWYSRREEQYFNWATTERPLEELSLFSFIWDQYLIPLAYIKRYEVCDTATLSSACPSVFTPQGFCELHGYASYFDVVDILQDPRST